MAAGDLLLDADGNLILDADGNLGVHDGVSDACCCYRQARKCLNEQLADVWMTRTDAAELPGAFSIDDICYYFGSDTGGDPGTIYTPDDATPYDSCVECPRACGPCFLVVGQTLEIKRPVFQTPAGATGDCTDAFNRYDAVRDIINSLPAILPFTITGFSPTTGEPIFAYTGAQPTLRGVTPNVPPPNDREWYWETALNPSDPAPDDMIYLEAFWNVQPRIQCLSGAMRFSVRLQAHAEGQTTTPPYNGNSCGITATIDSPLVDVTDVGDCDTEQAFTWIDLTGQGWLADATGSFLLDAP